MPFNLFYICIAHGCIYIHTSHFPYGGVKYD